MADSTHSGLLKGAPPKLGHEVLKYYAFDPEYINLNNGEVPCSYGSTPVPVLDAIHKLTLQIEANPDLFHRLHFRPLLIDVRRRIAQLIGADIDEVVLVANASMGVNTVLRNFEWENGDTIVGCSTTYGSIDKTIRYIGDIKPHPTIKQFALQFPTTHKDIISSFKDFVAANPTIKDKKTVVVIDSIVSNPGVKLPWQELVKVCKEAGFYSVIDAAHSIGQETDIKLSKAQPDFWISNCHKWLSAKRSVAVLYVPKRYVYLRFHDPYRFATRANVGINISSSHLSLRLIHTPRHRTGKMANSISSGNVKSFHVSVRSPSYYDCAGNGTIDYAPFLSVTPALNFRNWLGGEHKINEYCHDLALKGGKRLAEIFGTQVMDPEGDLTLNMVNVELPFPQTVKPTQEIDSSFKEKLLIKYKVYSAHFYHNGRWWTRCSTQVWNELEDFEKLGKAWLSVCAETLEELGLKA
ncbi:hypothetical protein C0993_010257 [Termitomyces sp. T159_Od127]|nr:hypothetical protein C0993_010257 [Termitomyces sp. T159_Od127]